MTRSQTARRCLRDQEGASATVFVIALLSLFSVAMLAIDGGSLYVSRRGQVADTDAAALAATRHLIGDPCSTQSEIDGVAEDYIDLNDPSTSMIGQVEVTNTSGLLCPKSGTVEVTTEREATMFFAPLFGYDRLPTGVSSTVIFGPGAVFPGVRPLGICGMDPHYAIEWEPYVKDLRNGVDPDTAYANYEARIAIQDPLLDPEAHDGESHPVYAMADYTHRISFERASSGGSPCPGAPGNFGFLDFDSGGNRGTCDEFSNEINCGIAEGADVSVALGGSDPDDEDCNLDDDSIEDCPPQTGALGKSTVDALNSVKCDAGISADSCEKLLFVVYNHVDGTGNNAEYDVYSVAMVVLRGFDIGGGNLNANHYLDLEFVDDVVEGTVGNVDPSGTAPPVFNLCGANDYTNC